MSVRFVPLNSLSSSQLLLVGAIVLLSVNAVHGQARIPPEVAEAFGINDGEIVSLENGQGVDRDHLVNLRLSGADFTLELQPHSIRSEDFILRVQQPDGSYVDQEPEDARTVRGFVRNIRGSRVVGSVLESVLIAKIVLGEQQTFFIEPISSRLDENRFRGLHLVYRKSDLRPHRGWCSNNDPAIHQASQYAKAITRRHTKRQRVGGRGDYPRGGAPGLQIAELAVDADVEYFSTYGTVQETLDRMELVVNIVNDQFEADVNLTHTISGALVRTDEPDPYDSTDAATLVMQFRNHWNSTHGDIQRDLAHLFTGKDIDGPVIGRAFDIGAICNNRAYCFAQSDYNGNLGCATDLTAHELGHLWNASHCSCSGFTMNPGITCANQFNPELTIPDIVAYRDTLNCLDDGSATPPPNDDWINSIFLSGTGNFNTGGNNLAATTEPFEQQLQNTASTVWWHFNALADGTVTIDTFGSDFNTQLHIYTGYPADFQDLVPVVDNNNSGGLQSQVTFTVGAGSRYEVRVGGFRSGEPGGSGSEGNITLNGSFIADGMLVGDVNCDGIVNLLDVDPFVVAVSAGVYDFKADTNQDGVVDLLDVDPFVDLLVGE